MPWGAVAGAVISAGAGIAEQSMQGDPTVNQQTQLPQWYTNAQQDLYNRASGLTGQAYQPYTGPRVANLAPDELSGIGLTQHNVGSWQPYLGNAAQMIETGAGGVGNLYQPQSFTSQNVGTPTWDTNAAQQYMNPFISTVGNYVSNQINNQYDQQQQRNNTAAIQAGAFGGERASWENAANDYYRNQAIGSTLSNLAMQGYQNAQGMFTNDAQRNLAAQQFNSGQNLVAQQLADQSAYRAAGLAQNDQQRMLTAGGQMAGLGQLQAGLGGQDASQLMQIGALERGLAQQNLDVGYQNYLDQRQWPYQQQQFLSGILSGQNVPVGQSTTYPSPSIMGQAINGGLMGLGVYRAWNQQNGSNPAANTYSGGLFGGNEYAPTGALGNGSWANSANTMQGTGGWGGGGIEGENPIA